jgi:hypothetical protein
LARIIVAMRRLLLLMLVGFCAFAAVYVATSPAPVEAPDIPAESAAADAVEIPSPEPVGFDLRPAAGGGTGRIDESLGDVVRDVTPANMTARPTPVAPMRVERPEPVEAPAPPQAARRELLFKPIVAAAGMIEADQRKLRLDGIAAPEPAENCGEGALAWPCGENGARSAPPLRPRPRHRMRSTRRCS